MTPEYSPTFTDVVSTVLVAVPISALTIVPDAPLESVIVTSLLLKSIPDSLIISSPASAPSLSERSKFILPLPVLSSSKKFSFASVLSESVPSRTRLIPCSSVPTKLPAPVPSESKPSKSNNEVISFS